MKLKEIVGHHPVHQYIYYGVPESKEKEKGAESLFKQIMAENFPNTEKETELQI